MDGPDALRVAVAGEIFIPADGNGHLFQPVMPGFDVEILGGREPILRDIQSRRPIPQNHQAVRVLVRQRPDQQRIRNAEKGSASANPDGKRKRDDGNETRALPECAKGKAKVFEQRIHLEFAGILTRAANQCRRVALFPSK